VNTPQFDADDIQSAILCAWKEARGEGEIGMRAVLHVLKNRVGYLGFATNLHDVIYGKNQFTSMSVSTDPEFNLQPCAGDEAFLDCVKASEAVFDDDDPDVTHGAHYYANLHEIEHDGWFEREIVLKSDLHPITAQIGRHTFFR
jgi:Cell Wall Hydrolase